MTDQHISLREIFSDNGQLLISVIENYCKSVGNSQYEQAMTKAIAGAELGFGPIQSQRAFYINSSGQLLLHTDAMVSVAQMNGVVVSMEHSVPPGQYCLVRATSSSGEQGYEFTCTAEMAEKAGWTNSTIWRQQPWDVLYARCAAHVMRKVCPHLFACYLPEELGVELPEEPKTPAKQVQNSTVKRDNFRTNTTGDFF